MSEGEIASCQGTEVIIVLDEGEVAMGGWEKACQAGRVGHFEKAEKTNLEKRQRKKNSKLLI